MSTGEKKREVTYKIYEMQIGKVGVLKRVRKLEA